MGKSGNEKKIIAMIPARLGSTRIPMKNLRLLMDKPLINYAIDLALASNSFDKIYVNTESDIIGKIAINAGVDFYKRSEHLSNNNITNRDFTYDFLKNNNCDYLVMLNTTSPTLRVQTIKNFCTFVQQNDYDTVLSTVSEKAEFFYENVPLNFNFSEKINSQNLSPLTKVIWALTAWKKDSFIKLQEQGNNPIFGGNLGLFNIPKDESCDLDTEEDWRIAEGIIKSREIETIGKYYEFK